MLSNCLAGIIGLFSSSRFLSLDELIELSEVEILFEAFDYSARQWNPKCYLCQYCRFLRNLFLSNIVSNIYKITYKSPMV
jgi:hypothetical protein